MASQKAAFKFNIGAQDGTQYDVQVGGSQKSSDIYNYSKFK